MPFLYSANEYGIRRTPYDEIRETERCFIADGRRVKKISAWANVYRSYAEARAHILDIHQSAVTRASDHVKEAETIAREQLAKAERELQKVEESYPEDESRFRP